MPAIFFGFLFSGYFFLGNRRCAPFVCRLRQIDAHSDIPRRSGQRARDDARARDASGATGADCQRRLGFFGLQPRVPGASLVPGTAAAAPSTTSSGGKGLFGFSAHTFRGAAGCLAGPRATTAAAATRLGVCATCDWNAA